MDNKSKMNLPFWKKVSDVNEYWGEKMPIMAMEELGELSQAISKMERKGDAASRQNLIEEMADVQIAISALKVRYGLADTDEVFEQIKKKLDKKY